MIFSRLVVSFGAWLCFSCARFNCFLFCLGVVGGLLLISVLLSTRAEVLFFLLSACISFLFFYRLIKIMTNLLPSFQKKRKKSNGLV
jgi:hypothetical protein